MEGHADAQGGDGAVGEAQLEVYPRAVGHGRLVELRPELLEAQVGGHALGALRRTARIVVVLGVGVLQLLVKRLDTEGDAHVELVAEVGAQREVVFTHRAAALDPCIVADVDVVAVAANPRGVP